jgi:hypothetical protein
MFYPSEGPVPEALQTDEFLLPPLRATDAQLDYDAVISSRAELLCGSGRMWPREGFTFEGIRLTLSVRCVYAISPAADNKRTEDFDYNVQAFR